MKIFTKEWTQQIRERYEKLPEYQRPVSYFIATSPDFQSERDEVEKWLTELPHVSNEKIISNLKSPKGFVQTYHELAVGYLIKQLGYQPEYEKNIGDNLTPDWYVHPKQGMPGFVLELFTANTSEVEMKLNNQRNDLFHRLHQISVNAILRVRFNKPETLSQKRNKTIAYKVMRWLRSKPPIKDQLNLKEVKFEIIEYNTNFSDVQFIGSYSSFVNPARLRKNFKDKVRKYEKITNEMGIPLIVGVIATPRTGFCLANIYDVLHGQDAQRIIYSNDKKDKLIATRAIRMPNGIFKQETALSAALWIWKDSLTKEWEIRTLRNPNPEVVNSLPVEVFN